MGMRLFFKLEGTILDIILKILCLICWGLGGCIYIYCHYEVIVASTLFPGGMKIVLAVWSLLMSLRFFALWVPMGFALNYWQMKRIVVPIVYAAGCFIGIIFSLLAFILVLDYVISDLALQEEYIHNLKVAMKGSEFPAVVKNSMESYKCCGWNDPTDFSPHGMFDISASINDKNKAKFMTEVAGCYGKTFTVNVSKENDGLVYFASNAAKKSDIPEGCGMMLIDTANRQCSFILVMAIIVIILTLAIAVLYLINYVKLPSPQINATPGERMEMVAPSQAVSVDDTVNGEVEPGQSSGIVSDPEIHN